MFSRFLPAVAAVALLSLPAMAALDNADIPPGVTIKIVRIGEMLMVPGSNSNQPRERIIFADTAGATLYESAADTTPLQSNCDAACAEEWPPFIAASDAEVRGDWTIVTRSNGAKQWAFRGKPLYTNAKDAAAKAAADAAAGSGARAPSASATNGHDVDGRQVVELRPDSWMPLPMGINVQEVRTAPGQVLTNQSGQPLYMFTGKPGDTPMAQDWLPFHAPQIALPIGDFTVVTRKDGAAQWAYKGRALYTFTGDLYFGDSNGKYAGGPFELAFVMRYFQPASVTVRKDHAFGGLLTTTDDRTLYVRENGGDGADSAQRSERGNPNTGKTIGLTGCDAACERTWQPLLAPADAVASSYWNVYERDDGKKQWAYYGYALYTLAGEAPDMMNGHLIYDDVDNYELLPDGSARKLLRLRWRVAPP